MDQELFRDQLNDAALNAARQRTDPPADQLLDTLVDQHGPEASRNLFNSLIRNIDLPLAQLPPEVRQFVEVHRSLPDWAYNKKIRKAQLLFVDHGPKLLLFLYYKSLPILYACKHGAQVLIHTGRLAHEGESLAVFKRRIAETGQFLINVMQQGGFRAGGKAIESALKVRLIHAAIRQFIPAEHWDAEVLGQPINQEDMAITLMTFGVALTDALSQFGIEETEEKVEAYFHTWNIVGHLMGVEEALLPPDVAAGRQLLERIQQRQSAASPAGQQLTAALVDFAQKTLPSKHLKNAPAVLIPFLIGEERAAMLGVQNNQGCLIQFLPEVLKGILGLSERLEDRSEPLRILLDLLSKEMVLRMVNYFNPEKQTPFRVPKGWVGKT